MSNHRYTIGTGFVSGKDEGFSFQIWMANSLKFSKPEKVIVLAVGGRPNFNILGDDPMIAWVEGNLGHIGDLLDKRKPHKFCGWSMGMMTLALLAYQNETDFIYKEQDCLAFGPWVERLYAECGDKKVCFGKNGLMTCAQSLFLVKHDFIPEFVRSYLGTGPDAATMPETKFSNMAKVNQPNWTQFGFGVDRDRPIPWDDEVWYAQHFTQKELAELTRRNLI